MHGHVEPDEPARSRCLNFALEGDLPVTTPAQRRQVNCGQPVHGEGQHWRIEQSVPAGLGAVAAGMGAFSGARQVTGTDQAT